MKIVISESQYKNLLLEYGYLTTDEMEEYFVMYFESLERYQNTIRKLFRLWSNNRIKDVTFSWDPRSNINQIKSFAYQTRFFSNMKGTTQFSFSHKPRHGIYEGQFNGYITVSDGMRIYDSIKLVPMAYDQNYSKISSYLKNFLKDPAFKNHR
jgi:hypothetical protein